MITVYDRGLIPIAILDRPLELSYEMMHDGIWQASVTLLGTDPKAETCQPLCYLNILDGNTSIGLFRILSTTFSKEDEEGRWQIEVEHVLATLMDDVLFQSHEVIGLTVRDIIEFILSQQTEKRWVLGEVETDKILSLSWENETVLNALWSVKQAIGQGYGFSWDTDAYPWRLHITRSASEVMGRMAFGHNMTHLTRTLDFSGSCTRLYPLGYGEGVNQLTIREVNGGVPYLDADSKSAYGVIAKVWVDRRMKEASQLLTRAKDILRQWQEPRVSYAFKGVDLSQYGFEGLSPLRCGDRIDVTDEALAAPITVEVVRMAKRQALTQPEAIEMDLVTSPHDVSHAFALLARRQQIEEVYAQGATNLDSHHFMDNCDPDHPALLRFYIPEETVRINKMLLSYEVTAFRAYSRAIEGGGASTITSEDGGAETLTSQNGGSSTVTSSSGGATIETSSPGVWTLYPPQYLFADFMNSAGGHSHTTQSSGTHNHGITNGTKLAKAGGGSVTYVSSGAHQHQTDVQGEHVHAMYSVSHQHDVTLPGHAHQVNIPSHQHEVRVPSHHHSIQLPSHTHGIEYGIYLSPDKPSAIRVEVDGTPIHDLGLSEAAVDVIPYLAKDDEGRVLRGRWHEIRLTPNQIGRVTASVVTQLFVRSEGGGSY